MLAVAAAAESDSAVWWIKFLRRCRSPRIRTWFYTVASSSRCAIEPHTQFSDHQDRPIHASISNKKFELMLTWRAKTYSMPMLICNRFHKRLANNGKIATFMGIPLSMLSCAGFLVPIKSRLGPSKSTFNAENFLLSFSMSISIDIGAILSWNVSRNPKSPKIH